MRHLAPNLIIISAFQSTESLEKNKENHDNVLKNLKVLSVPYAVVKGCYKGKEELSVMIDAKYRSVVDLIMTSYNQESYLEHHNDRSCDLVYNNGARVKLGTMKNVTETMALSKDAWTKTSDGRYFIVE